MLTRVNNSFRANVPQLYLDVDRTKVQTLGIQLNDVFSTLAAYLGSAYVNDFSVFGRTYRVMIQADAAYRSGVDDISRLEVRDQDGNMIPLSTLLTVRDSVGPQAVTRYNLFPSASITGSPRPGFSSGQAREAMEELAARLLPPTMGYERTGTTYQETVAGNQAPILFGLAFVFVFLFMAAQYESWLIPLAVIFAIPLALIGAIYGTLLRSYDNNVYTQIGLILLIGISAKTAILIVEFAKQLREEGRPTLEAAVEAARLRFRAVLMTAVSFILGVVPLLVASGAGAGSRRALCRGPETARSRGGRRPVRHSHGRVGPTGARRPTGGQSAACAGPRDRCRCRADQPVGGRSVQNGGPRLRATGVANARTHAGARRLAFGCGRRARRGAGPSAAVVGRVQRSDVGQPHRAGPCGQPRPQAGGDSYSGEPSESRHRVTQSVPGHPGDRRRVDLEDQRSHGADRDRDTHGRAGVNRHRGDLGTGRVRPHQPWDRGRTRRLRRVGRGLQRRPGVAVGGGSPQLH